MPSTCDAVMFKRGTDCRVESNPQCRSEPRDEPRIDSAVYAERATSVLLLCHTCFYYTSPRIPLFLISRFPYSFNPRALLVAVVENDLFWESEG